jgi:integrase
MNDRQAALALLDLLPPELRTGVGLVRFMGLRVSEAVHMRWNDIDSDRMRVTITGGNATHTRRTVPLDLDCVNVLNMELIRQLRGGSRVRVYVVPHVLRVAARRCGLTDKAWDDRLIRAMKRADMSPVTLAELRESLRAEWSAEFGGPIADKWLGSAYCDRLQTSADEVALELASRIEFD